MVLTQAAPLAKIRNRIGSSGRYTIDLNTKNYVVLRTNLLSAEGLSDGVLLAVRRDAERLSASVNVVGVIVVVQDEGAALLHEDRLDVVPVEQAQGGVALRDVPLEISAVAVVEEQGAGV